MQIEEKKEKERGKRSNGNVMSIRHSSFMRIDFLLLVIQVVSVPVSG